MSEVLPVFIVVGLLIVFVVSQVLLDWHSPKVIEEPDMSDASYEDFDVPRLQ